MAACKALCQDCAARLLLLVLPCQHGMCKDLPSFAQHQVPIFTLHDAETRHEPRGGVGPNAPAVLTDVAQPFLTLSCRPLCGCRCAAHQVIASHQLPALRPTEWLWCETWCSQVSIAAMGPSMFIRAQCDEECQESKKSAKTIDLCQNPLTKDCREEIKFELGVDMMAWCC